MTTTVKHAEAPAVDWVTLLAENYEMLHASGRIHLTEAAVNQLADLINLRIETKLAERTGDTSAESFKSLVEALGCLDMITGTFAGLSSTLFTGSNWTVDITDGTWTWVNNTIVEPGPAFYVGSSYGLGTLQHTGIIKATVHEIDWAAVSRIPDGTTIQKAWTALVMPEECTVRTVVYEQTHEEGTLPPVITTASTLVNASIVFIAKSVGSTTWDHFLATMPITGTLEAGYSRVMDSTAIWQYILTLKDTPHETIGFFVAAIDGVSDAFTDTDQAAVLGRAVIDGTLEYSYEAGTPSDASMIKNVEMYATADFIFGASAFKFKCDDALLQNVHLQPVALPALVDL